MLNKYIPLFEKDVMINFAIQIILFIFSFVTGVIISRTLGPSGKGIYSIATMIPAMAALLINLGLNSSNIYYIGKKTYPTGTIIGNTFFFALFAGTLLSAILLCFSGKLSLLFLKDANPVYLYLTLPSITLILLFSNIYNIFIAHRDMIKLAIHNVSQVLIYFLIIVLLFFFNGVTVQNIIFAFLAGYTVSTVVGVYFIFKSNYFLKLSIDLQVFYEMIKFGFKQHLGAIFQIFNYQLDMFIIAVMLNSTQVGLYSIAVLIGGVIWYIPNSLSQILFSKTAASSSNTANDFTPLVCRNVTFLVFLIVSFVFFIAGPLIPFIFTDKFNPSIIALRLLLPGIFFLSISKVLASDIVGRGFPHYASYASFISLLFTITLDLVLIPIYGINGAAVASSIAYFVHALVTLYYFNKITKISLKEVFLIKLADFSYYKNIFSRF